MGVVSNGAFIFPCHVDLNSIHCHTGHIKATTVLYLGSLVMLGQKLGPTYNRRYRKHVPWIEAVGSQDLCTLKHIKSTFFPLKNSGPCSLSVARNSNSRKLLSTTVDITMTMVITIHYQPFTSGSQSS